MTLIQRLIVRSSIDNQKYCELKIFFFKLHGIDKKLFIIYFIQQKTVNT